MPALPDAPGCLRCALSGTIDTSNQWLTRFYVHYSGTAPATADLATFIGAIASTYTTNIKPLHVGLVELTQIEVIDLSSPTSAVGVSSEAISGSKTGTSIGAGVAMVTSYEIARRYRGGHPRGYWPWGGTGDLSGNNAWSSSFLTTCTTAITSFYTAVLAAGWTGAGTLTHVNVSYYEGFSVVTNPITGRARNVPTLRTAPVTDNVTSVVCRSSLGSQRRRNAFID